jgi:hypothetical protein
VTTIDQHQRNFSLLVFHFSLLVFHFSLLLGARCVGMMIVISFLDLVHVKSHILKFSEGGFERGMHSQKILFLLTQFRKIENDGQQGGICQEGSGWIHLQG